MAPAAGAAQSPGLAFSREHSNRDHDPGGQYDHARKQHEVSQKDGHVSPAELAAWLGGVLMLGRRGRQQLTFPEPVHARTLTGRRRLDPRLWNRKS
jgi:hypothetical protein